MITPLIEAIQNNLPHDEIKTLIVNTTNLDEKDEYGLTALNWASCYRHLEIIKLLLEKGAKIEEKSNGGSTALICASCNGRQETVKFLLEKGAKMDEKDNGGRTALIWASRYGHLETVKLLETHKKHQQLQLFLKLSTLLSATPQSSPLRSASKLLHSSLEILSISILFQKLIEEPQQNLTFSEQYNLITYLKQSPTTTTTIILPSTDQIPQFLEYLKTL